MANLTRIKNNQITDSTITNVKIASGTLTGDLMNPTLTFNSNLTLNGNLIVTGNVTAVQSTSTQITDPLITLGQGNPGISYDLGPVLIRGSGGNRFMGWKENADAFVFINTTEDGTTTGNIATTSYSNVVVGNLITIGSTTHSDITLSGNTVSARGALTLVSGSGSTTFSNAVVMNSSLAVTSTLNIQGTATVNALVSNGAIQATTIGGSGNATVSALTVNNSATMTTLGVTGNITSGNISVTGAASVGTLVVQGGLQNTPIGNATPSTGNFTTLTAGTSFNTSGTATVNALVSNGAIQGTTIGGSGQATFASVVSNGAIQGTTIGGSGQATFASVVSNGAIQGTTISGSGTGTFASVVSNGAIQGTTIGASGNATVAALTVNASATVGTTLSAAGGIQNTPIGNVTAASGAFTTLNATGAITGATTLTTTGTATVNALISNTSIGGSSLTIANNAEIFGNLTVHGNSIVINSQTLNIIDPIIELNTGPNNTPLTTNNGFDSGVSTHYYDTADRRAFFGRTNDTGYFEYYSNVASEAGNVITGTYGTIKTGNLQLLGLASVGTTLSVAGNATVNALTVNNSATVGGALGVTGNIIGSNLNVGAGSITASNAVFTNNVTIAGTLTATSNVVANTSGIFFGNTTTGITAIYGGLPTYTVLPNVVAQFTSNVNNYAQINTQNLNNGSQASTDFVVTAGNGNDTAYFGDFGIASNTYSFAGYGAIGANDTYLIANGGNLLLNAGSSGKGINFAVGASDAADIKAKLDTTRFSVNLTTASTNSTTGAIVTAGGLGVAGAINGGSTLNVTDTATVNALVSNGAIQGTTVGASGNATVAALTVNASATVGTTLRAAGGIQGTPIGNVTISTGAFSSLTTNGATTIQGTGDSTGPTNGSIVINGGAGIAKALNVGTTATLGNVTFSNTTISSNLTNTGVTINPNGTGATTINSSLNNSRTVINGTQANVLVVSGAQVGANVNSFVSGATFQIGSNDSMLLPVGTQGERPGSPTAGMLRYSTTAGAIEWYTGTSWGTASSSFTVATANTQTGNGSATLFTLPVANATTAGTIVSINGIVQQPITAYSVTGANVSFTEAPSSTDVIDFRVFTTTTTVTSVVDALGTTGLFLDTPTVGNKVIVFKTNGSESLSIQANNEIQATGNITPTANITYSLGTTSRRWKDLWLSGSTIYLGNVQIKESAGTISFYAADGTTPAPVQADVTDAGGIQNTPIGNATPSSGAFTTLSVTSNITTTGNAASNIGSLANQFNTVFAKATSAQYADLAENYLGDAYYEPGTVVDFGGEFEVTISTTEMSQRVAGVVSTNPAYLMNSGLTGIATPVALQGRVPCKVTGAVRKGDMMVSAGNGTARSATAPSMGSVIGKALENFDGEQGVIEVVVGRL